jgi:hypothetical protein
VDDTKHHQLVRVGRIATDGPDKTGSITGQNKRRYVTCRKCGFQPGTSFSPRFRFGPRSFFLGCGGDEPVLICVGLKPFSSLGFASQFYSTLCCSPSSFYKGIAGVANGDVYYPLYLCDIHNYYPCFFLKHGCVPSPWPLLIQNSALCIKMPCCIWFIYWRVHRAYISVCCECMPSSWVL